MPSVEKNHRSIELVTGGDCAGNIFGTNLVRCFLHGGKNLAHLDWYHCSNICARLACPMLSFTCVSPTKNVEAKQFNEWFRDLN